MAKLAEKITGWQVVTLVGLILGTIVALVAMGQPLSGLVAAAVAVASILGVNVVQVAANQAGSGARLDKIDQQTNGTNQKLMQQVVDSHRRETALAALVAPDKVHLLAQILGEGGDSSGLGSGSGDPETTIPN